MDELNVFAIIIGIVALLVLLNKLNGFGWPWQWAAMYGGGGQVLLGALVFFGAAFALTVVAFGTPW